jgi:exodeoxyribonuclease VII small subunit
MPKASAPSKSASTISPEQEGPALPASYEDAMQELEALVRRLESGEMPLDQLLSGYQRGAALLQLCRDRLQAVEDQIKVLDDGSLKVWKAQ